MTSYRFNEFYAVQRTSLGYLIWCRRPNSRTENVHTAPTLAAAQAWCSAAMARLYG
jgi:hypothetical protein